MTLGSTAIPVISEWGTFRDESRLLSLCAARACVRATLSAADEMSCSMSELSIVAKQDLALDSAALRDWGDRLATRIRYLLEAIDAVELDTMRGLLLLRSSPPDKRGAGTYYYEVLLERTGRLTLQRFRFDNARKERIPVALQLTKETFEKLLDDLEAITP